MNKIELEEALKDIDEQMLQLQLDKRLLYEDYIENTLNLKTGTRFTIKNGYYMNRTCQMCGSQAFVLNKDNSVNKRIGALQIRYLAKLDKDDFIILEQEVK